MNLSCHLPESLMTYRVLISLVSMTVSSVLAANPLGTAESFFEAHCYNCHDDTTQKGELDLTSLKFDPANKATFARWVSVFDRVREGEMPPKKKARPPETEKAAFLSDVAKALTAAEQTRHKREGRVVFRRLNRTEYENTLRDLFALPNLSVREMLPADDEAHGFDTVGEALNLSYVQITKYLETAEIALDRAITRELTAQEDATQKAETIRKTGSQIGRFQNKNGEVQHLGDARILLRQPNSAQTGWFLNPLIAPRDGEYRIRVSCYGVVWDEGEIKPADRPHMISIYAKSDNITRLLRTFDAPPDQAAVLETTAWLSGGDSFVAHIASLDDRNDPIRNKKRGLPYAGPGLAIEWFEIEGPIPQPWPPRDNQPLFAGLPVKRWTEDSGFQEPPAPNESGTKEKYRARPLIVVSENPERDAERLLRQFMTRAFRRPVANAEVKTYLPLIQRKLAQKHTFQEAMRTGFKAVLCSPDFLFFEETPGRLGDFALASRLSYFLWKSMPDEMLLALAGKGDLSKPEVLRAQTERLLDDRRSERFVEDFLGQWLELRRIGFTEPDKQLYPEFTPVLQTSMIAETHAFFAAMLREDLGSDHLVRSDFAFVNAPLAALYDIPNIKGVALRRVKLPAESPRGGFLTQGSVLKITANGTTTSPVTRGVWIMDRLLGRPVPPPPPGVGSIDPDVRGTTTIREQLAKHSTEESCAGCHRKIDPPGFALESFDVMGGWRERFRSLGKGDAAKPQGDLPVRYTLGLSVDASGESVDGRPFRDIHEFRRILLSDREQLARNLTERLLVYATGAGISFADRAEVESILFSTAAKNHGARSLVHAVIQSPTFQFK